MALMVKPLPPCDREDYRHHQPPYPKCGQPATGRLAKRWPFNLCREHLLEMRRIAAFYDPPQAWQLTLVMRELVYKAGWYGLPESAADPGGLMVAQVCPTCLGRGEVWVEEPLVRANTR